MGGSTLKIRRSQRSSFNPDQNKTVAVPPPPAPGKRSEGAGIKEAPTLSEDRSLIPLQIRSGQQQVFEQAALKKFEDEMVVHSQEFSPKLCAVLGEEQLRVALRQSITKAGGYGFTFRGPLRLFVEMIFLFGSGFDTDPQYPWATQILKTSDDQMKRAEKLYNKILDYQEKVSGPGGANTRRALRDLLVMAQKPLNFSPSTLSAGMRQEMHRVFPEKTSYIGDMGMIALIREGSAEARKHRFPARGESVLTVLIFAFGHGCTDDPLYPWIGRTLKDDKIVDATARVERLEKKAVTWLEHVLESPQEGGPP